MWEIGEMSVQTWEIYDIQVSTMQISPNWEIVRIVNQKAYARDEMRPSRGEKVEGGQRTTGTLQDKKPKSKI